MYKNLGRKLIGYSDRNQLNALPKDIENVKTTKTLCVEQNLDILLYLSSNVYLE